MNAPETPGQAARTLGQANREAFGELGADWYPGTPWDKLHEDLRAQWEAGAQAVIDAATEGSLRACGYTLADVGRFLEAEAAAQEPKPAPGSLRADLEETLANWREDATYRLTDTRDEMSEHVGVTACSDTLAGILADHPADEPKPAPELRAAMAETRQLRELLDDFTHAVIDYRGTSPAITDAAKSVRKKAGLPPVEGK